MKILLAICFLLIATPSPAMAQAGALEGRLVAETKVISAGAEAQLTLIVKVLEDTDVDATILRGVHLTTKIDGAEGATIGGEVSGSAKVAAGTEIRRRLRVRLGSDQADAGLQRVTVTWPNLPGATASIQLAPDQASIDLDRLDYQKTQVMLITSMGDMTVAFYADKAPNHVRNFVELSKTGFYDGTRFHRILRGFMIQGGCPNTKAGATGQPGMGDRADGVHLQAEFTDVRHQRGVLSMARGGDPNSASCQFFICHGSPSHLDGQYSAFGELRNGDDTLEAIATVAVGGQGRSTPIEPVHLHKAIVLPVYK